MPAFSRNSVQPKLGAQFRHISGAGIPFAPRLDCRWSISNEVFHHDSPSNSDRGLSRPPRRGWHQRSGPAVTRYLLGRIGQGSTIVCTLTGHGLKDPDTAIAQCVQPQTVDAELSEIERLIGAHLKG